MKFLILLLSCSTCLAQFPYSGTAWSSSRPAAGDLVSQQLQIAYYWNSQDLTIGSSNVVNWKDRIQNIIATQTTGAAQGTNSALGLRFTRDSTYYTLTNQLNMQTNGACTNVSVFIIWRWDGNGDAGAGARPVVLHDVKNAYASANAAYCLHSGDAFRLHTEAKDADYIVYNSTMPSGALHDNLFEMPGGPGTNTFFDGVNQVLVANIMTNITHFGFTNDTGVGYHGFGGYIALLAIFTNGLPTSTVVSNLHYYGTNTFGYSP